MPTISNWARRVTTFAVSHSPSILTTVGIAGTLSTAFLAARATWEASNLIAQKETLDERNGVVIPDPKELLKQRVQLVWKLYLPATGVAVLTIGAVWGSNRISAGRAASIATAYTLLERNHDAVKNKIVEKFGQKKADEVHGEVAADMVRNKKVRVEDLEIAMSRKQMVCFDVYGGQYFVSTPAKIEHAEVEFNRMMLHNGIGMLADLYGLLGMDEIPEFSYHVGWNTDRLLETYTDGAKHNDIAVITMMFRHPPLPDYGRFRRI